MEFQTNDEVAALLRIEPKTLHNMRGQRRGPPFVKIGGRILYAKSDVLAYIAAHRREPEAERSARRGEAA
jgi:hypothetical protein